MSKPQPGILDDPKPERRFLEYDLKADATDTALRGALRKALAGDGATVVVAFSAKVWGLLSGDRPAQLRDFAPIGAAPASQRDLWFWIQGDSHDAVLDHALALHKVMAAVADLALEVEGYPYHGDRDLIGFVDGTANPKGDAAPLAAFIPTGEAGAGGAYLLTQKWVTNLDRFLALPVGEQEQVIGRTKEDDIELEGDAMPATSHVSRTDVALDGVPAKILRRSSPYGGVGEHGLYFVAFACDLERFEIQLKRMYGATDDGLHDRLTEFSTPVTGAYWFAPSRVDLAAVLDL